MSERNNIRTIQRRMGESFAYADSDGDWCVEVMNRNHEWSKFYFPSESEARSALKNKIRDKSVKEWKLVNPKGKIIYK